MGITQFKSYKIYVFINMVITKVKNRSTDMILTAFDRKFHEKKEGPPSPARPPERGVRGAAAPREEEKEGVYSV